MDYIVETEEQSQAEYEFAMQEREYECQRIYDLASKNLSDEDKNWLAYFMGVTTGDKK